jgi:hypothetical protein
LYDTASLCTFQGNNEAGLDVDGKTETSTTKHTKYREEKRAKRASLILRVLHGSSFLLVTS